MSLNRTEGDRERTYDERRVSFSLPRSKRVNNMPDERLEDPSALNWVDSSVESKHKKKWKVKLPWKQKKQIEYYTDSHIDDVLDEICEGEAKDDAQKPSSVDSGDEGDVVNARSDPSPSPPTPRKQNRPITWHEDFRSAGPSNNIDIPNTQAHSLPMPKEETSEKRRASVSHQTTKTEFRADDVDFIPSSGTLSVNSKQNKGKSLKFRLNFKSFNQKSWSSFDNAGPKSPERDERDLSSTEGSSSPDIRKSSLSEDHLRNSNSSLTDIEDQNYGKSRHQSGSQLSGKKVNEDVFVEPIASNVYDHRKKSSSLPSFFKKSKKKNRELDIKASSVPKEYSVDHEAKSIESPGIFSRGGKTGFDDGFNAVPSVASNSELHDNNVHPGYRSGPQPSTQPRKRRPRSIYKMSRSSFISDSSRSKSSELLTRNVPAYIDRVETGLKSGDPGSRSLDSIDTQSTGFERHSSSARNMKLKRSYVKNNSSDLSNSDLRSPKHNDRQSKSKEKMFDQNFKRDFAIKMTQSTGMAPKTAPAAISRINKSPDLSVSDMGSPELGYKRDLLKKQTSDQSLKLDDFTKFIKSYSSSKSAKTAVGSQKKKSVKASVKNVGTPEIVYEKKKGDQSFKTSDDFTEEKRVSISSTKTKTQKNDPKSNSSELSSSDVGTFENSDREEIMRSKRNKESSIEPNDFTEFIKNYNSSKSSKILLASHKHKSQKLEVIDHLNNNVSKQVSVDVHKLHEENVKKNFSNRRDSLNRKYDDDENANVPPTRHADRETSLLPRKNSSNKDSDSFAEFSQITNLHKNDKSKHCSQEIPGKRSSGNSNDEAASDYNVRVRRRSYEEMTNLIEEQMFDSESEQGSSETDGDEVDLSFGRKLKIDSKSKDLDFKLCVVTEQGSFNGTELVYEPKILLKKEISSSVSKSEISNSSQHLKKPSEAPPLPPLNVDKGSIPEFNATDAKPPKFTFAKNENEKTKRKKLRKSKRTRSISNTSDSDTSIEDSNGTLYANFSSKIDLKREVGSKVEQNVLSANSEKDRSNISDIDLDSDSPPIFLPSDPSSESKDIQTSHEHFDEYPIKKDRIESVNNKLSSASATGVAKSLYTQREDKNVSLFKRNIADLPVKNLSRPEVSPPSPPNFPPPPSPPDEISIVGSYNLKNFSPKYEYAPNLPTLSPSINNKRQPITCYPSWYRDKTDAGTQQGWKENDKYSYEDVGKSSQLFHKQDLNYDFRFVQNQLSDTGNKTFDEKSNIEKPLRIHDSLPAGSTVKEKSYERYYPDVQNQYIEEDYNRTFSEPAAELNAAKKQMVTFHLPSPTHDITDHKTPAEYSPSYVDIRLGGQNNQRPVAQNDTQFYHSWPHNLQGHHVNSMPNSSPMVQREVLSIKQDTLKVAHKEEEASYSNSEVTSSYEEKLHSSASKINSTFYQTFGSSTYPQGIDRSHERYINVNSPIPYSKQGRQLKSILKSNIRKDDNRQTEVTQPSLVQTNIRYIRPVLGEVRSGYRPIPKHLIPSSATSSTTYNSNIERVEITEDSSHSESEIPPPALPSYPPPNPRENWRHQQQFLGDLLHTETNRPISVHSHSQPSYLHSSNYTPTIIEVEGHHGRTLERESIYQNVIHASQV